MNTVQLRPNRPLRYRFDGNVAVPLEEEELAAAAEPSLPSAEAIAALVALYSDRAATKDDIAKHAATVEQARAATAAARKAQTDRARVDKEIAEARKQHDETLANERALAERDIKQRTRNVEGREQAVAEREKKAAALEAELQAKHAKIDRKLAMFAAAD